MDFNFVTDQISTYINAIGGIIMFLVMLRKVYLDMKERGSFNTVRLAILVAFALEVYSVFIEDWFYTWGIFPMEWKVSSDEIGPNSLGKGVVVALGLYLTFYMLEWKPLKFTGAYFFIGMVTYFLITGIDFMYFWYIVIGGVIGVTSMIVVGSKLRDNGAIGLGIFYLIAFIGVVVGMVPEISYIGSVRIPQLIFITEFAFGICFSFGLFKPYKEVQPQAQPQEQQDIVMQLAEAP
ncbi:MAG: hypothetical protein ACFFCS_17020 [Candidatus Hodarchaeota archaeon]